MYIDDTYRVARASINLGARYDYSKGMFPALPALDPNGVPTGQMSPANDDVYHWNTFSPRVGINYKVNDSGKTVVKAHYGRYYKLLEATEFRAAVPSVALILAATSAFPDIPVAAASLRRSEFQAAHTVHRAFEQQLTTDLMGQLRTRGADYGAWQDMEACTRCRIDSVATAAPGQARRWCTGC
jgi:hypothetical protein